MKSAAPNFVQGGAVDVSVLLVSYNTEHLLEECIHALRVASNGLQVEVVVVDNCSSDCSVKWLRENLSDGHLVENSGNVGFGRANNQAFGHCSGRYVLLLNTDAFVEPNALHVTLAYMDANLRCGVLGVRLCGRDGNLQPSCRNFPTPLNLFLVRTGLQRLFPSVAMIDHADWDAAAVQECDWVPGCYYLIRREVIVQVGLFDPRYFLYSEEVDHCRAVKAAGWSVVYCPVTTVVHTGGESAKSAGAISSTGRQISHLQIESELLYFRKHHGLAGVWLWLLLTWLAAALLSLKSILRFRPLANVVTFIGQAMVVTRSFARMSAGSRPLR